MSDVGIASVANFGILEYRSDAEPVDVVESSTAWTSAIANKSQKKLIIIELYILKDH